MADLSMYDDGNGGAWANTANDLQLVTSLWNQPYLALFGGQYEQSTPLDEADLQNSIERFDWWGNSIMAPDDPSLQFNSQTERTLDTISLSNEGLLEAQKAVLFDLAYLRDIADVEATVTLDGINRVRIHIRMIEPTNLSERNFVFLWDGTRVEEIISDDDLVTLRPNVWDDNRFWDDTDIWTD